MLLYCFLTIYQDFSNFKDQSINLLSGVVSSESLFYGIGSYQKEHCVITGARLSIPYLDKELDRELINIRNIPCYWLL